MYFKGIKDTFQTLNNSRSYKHAPLSKLYRILFRQQDWGPGQYLKQAALERDSSLPFLLTCAVPKYLY
jgi:hypothetical protein